MGGCRRKPSPCNTPVARGSLTRCRLFQVFALKYDEVFVLESRNPCWSMQEYAKVTVGDQVLWLVNQSDKAGVQTVTADLSDIRTWYPEIPVPRQSSPVSVRDKSTADRLDVFMNYVDPKGQATEVHFESPRPPKDVRDRNGSTFTHSAQTLSALLDIPARQEKHVKASISYDGSPAAVRRILGLFPVKALLVQTQAGFAVASMKIGQTVPGEITVERPIPGTVWPSESHETWMIRDNRLTYRRDTGSWVYTFERGGVAKVEAYQTGVDGPLLRIALSAPLPDLSRPFRGRVRRNFVADMSGQTLGYGYMEAWTDETGKAFLEILPLAPRWFRERPLRTTLSWDSASTEVVTQRIPAR